MGQLSELTNTKHQQLKLLASAVNDYAKTQHLLTIKVKEVAQALCDFPVFMTKNNQTGYWQLSAVSSFTLGENLLVENEQWRAVYRPSSIQTYPFYLMNSANSEQEYVIGIDQNHPAFSQEKGHALFDEQGQPTRLLKQVTSQLEGGIKDDIQTFQFGQKLNQLGLCKPINVVVQNQDQTIQTLTGLYTIDEDKLHSLSSAQRDELHQLGYMIPIHGLLLSIGQLNGLIQKHNQRHTGAKISSVKLEVVKG